MNITVYFNDPAPMGVPFTKESYFRAYSELAQEVEAQGDRFLVVRGQDSYLGKGVFSSGWQLTKGKLVPQLRVEADLIYNKEAFPFEQGVKVFNASEVATFCTDKWFMYQQLSQWCPPTFYAANATELASAVAKTQTELVVIKPVTGAEGKDVVVSPKAKASQVQPAFPVLVQEFLDSSGGVPGIVEGIHDFRLALYNGELLYSYYRTPPQGSYLANVAQGGRFEMIELARVPAVFKEIAFQIDQQFADIPHRFYGVDFALTSAGPKIIEMNANLGLLPNSDHPVFAELKKRLAQSFHQLAQHSADI